MEQRIKGMLLGNSFPITVDGTAPANLASYTWTCYAYAGRVSATELWIKNTGLDSTNGTSLEVAWTAVDLGSLTANADGIHSATYTLEFTGTFGGKDLIKFQETIMIIPEGT